MLIKLNEMEEKELKAFYGGEGALSAKLSESLSPVPVQ